MMEKCGNCAWGVETNNILQCVCFHDDFFDVSKDDDCRLYAFKTDESGEHVIESFNCYKERK